MNSYPKDVRIVKIIEETPLCKTYLFSSEADPIRYLAGQYITVQVGDALHITRSYSLSSAPLADHPYWSLTVKRVENGLYSRWALDNLKVGDSIRIVGVFGRFTLPEHPEGLKARYKLYAAGSGIVPVFSILKQLLHTGFYDDIVLHYSSNNPENTIFYDQLVILEKQYPRLKVVFYFSQVRDKPAVRLNNFEIPNTLSDFDTTTFLYICGPIDYMDTISINARTMGVPAANIHIEDYLSDYDDGYEGEERAIPPDLEPHHVKIHMKNTVKTVDVQYPKSILEAALEKGIQLPYSCFSGQCGNCVAQKTKGDIFMIYNAALTDADLERGLVLTCQGFPIHGDAEITFE